jgi:hypothetical protein
MSKATLGEALRVCWADSPVVVGFRDPGASTDIEADWLDHTTVPPAAFLEGWWSLAVSFFHGAWVGFITPSLSLEEVLRIVEDTARGHGYMMTAAEGPM